MTFTQAASQYFKQVAGNWDEISAGYFGKSVRDAAIAKAHLRPEMAVADVGAGTGFVAAGLAPLVKRVYVVDGSAEMLEVAGKNLSAFDNVEYHQADGLELPFPEESLDAVFANMYLHHSTDPYDAILEMARVLRPGGRLVITDMDAHPYAWLKEEMADERQGFERAELRAWFHEAGLVNVIVGGTGESCCAESSNPALKDGQGREARISVFVAAGTKRTVMRDAVSQYYAAAAGAGSCGCGSSTVESEGGCCGSTASEGGGCCGDAAREPHALTIGYSEPELAGAPKEAAEISLGCGNPLALANLKPGEVVVDIGSGGGLDAFLAAQKVGPSGRVIGVDMTPAMLERARESARRNGIENVEFRHGFAEEMPVEDGSADVIISNCVINLAEDKGQVFREAFRALKPGGRLEVSDIVASGAMPAEMQVNAGGWSECVTGALPEREYLDLIEDAGFEQALTRRSTPAGETGGVVLYRAIVQARKPLSKGCGCGSGCCG